MRRRTAHVARLKGLTITSCSYRLVSVVDTAPGYADCFTREPLYKTVGPRSRCPRSSDAVKLGTHKAPTIQFGRSAAIGWLRQGVSTLHWPYDSGMGVTAGITWTFRARCGGACRPMGECSVVSNPLNSIHANLQNAM